MDVETYLNRDPNIKIINQSSLNLENQKSQEEIEEIRNRGNFLLRQELEDKTPLCSVCCVVSYHLVFIVLFLSIAIPILASYDKNNYIEIEYTSCQKTDNNICYIDFSIDKNLSSPIFVYYRLDNFFTNHIDYVKSKSYGQLRGEEITDKVIDSTCKDMSRNKDHFGSSNDSLIVSFNNVTMSPNGILNPCGLIARSMFNDTFDLFTIGQKEHIDIFENDIASEIDIQKNFKNSKNSGNVQWKDKEDEHFMVWMNMELFPNFLKKWGRIERNLPAGEYNVKIKINWGKKEWGVKKYFVLAKGSQFGRDRFFAYILIAGVAAEIIVIIVVSLSCISKKQFNPEEMKWD